MAEEAPTLRMNLEKYQQPQARTAVDPDEFRRISVKLRGTMIAAHHQFATNGWTEADDMLLGVMSSWLEGLKSR